VPLKSCSAEPQLLGRAVFSLEVVHAHHRREHLKWSPCKFVKSFKTPALVVTGEKDYRVRTRRASKYYTGSQEDERTRATRRYPNAGHWPSWYEMAMYYDAHLDFFHQYLGGEPAPWNVTDFANNLAFEKKGCEEGREAGELVRAATRLGSRCAVRSRTLARRVQRT